MLYYYFFNLSDLLPWYKLCFHSFESDSEYSDLALGLTALIHINQGLRCWTTISSGMGVEKLHCSSCGWSKTVATLTGTDIWKKGIKHIVKKDSDFRVEFFVSVCCGMALTAERQVGRSVLETYNTVTQQLTSSSFFFSSACTSSSSSWPSSGLILSPSLSIRTPKMAKSAVDT